MYEEARFSQKMRRQSDRARDRFAFQIGMSRWGRQTEDSESHGVSPDSRIFFSFADIPAMEPARADPERLSYNPSYANHRHSISSLR